MTKWAKAHVKEYYGAGLSIDFAKFRGLNIHFCFQISHRSLSSRPGGVGKACVVLALTQISLL